MANKVIVIAPHPDDETLGCGGTLLKHKQAGDEIHWLVMTNVSTEAGYSSDVVDRRQIEIKLVAQEYQFDSVTRLDFRPAYLDTIPLGEIVERIGQVFVKYKPELVYMPYEGDIHTDHKVTFQAVASCCKTFRYNFIRKIMAYETLSETDFSLNSWGKCFAPNVFVPIDNQLQKKIDIMNIYGGEMGTFPFPRSEKAISSLAALRGTNANCMAAEGFMLLKEIVGV